MTFHVLCKKEFLDSSERINGLNERKNGHMKKTEKNEIMNEEIKEEFNYENSKAKDLCNSEIRDSPTKTLNR